jgi:hypothetical protein
LRDKTVARVAGFSQVLQGALSAVRHEHGKSVLRVTSKINTFSAGRKTAFSRR